MLEGRVVKAAGGFFTVSDPAGVHFTCRARGMLKRDQAALMVGDRVLFEPERNVDRAVSAEGVIEKLLPRSNRLKRPPVSNVDQLVVVMSLKEPACDWQLVSRLMVLAEQEKLNAFLCLNKTDLAAADEIDRLINELNPYPYSIIQTSAVRGSGLEELAEKLNGKCSVFAGPSGVGKSSLLNAIQPGLTLKTGTVSDKIKRGKHTTRQAELLTLVGGGMVVDTPGFTRLNFFDLGQDHLADLFPEFEPLRGSCGFRNCRHISEPECAVRREIGKMLNPIRYQHYQYFFDELRKQEAF